MFEGLINATAGRTISILQTSFNQSNQSSCRESLDFFHQCFSFTAFQALLYLCQIHLSKHLKKQNNVI